MAGYGAAVVGLATLARVTGRGMPKRLRASDLAMTAVATFKISRLITKAGVTRPLRAPFTDVEEAAGEGELNERPSGTGMRHVVGELVACPFCASVWTATGLVAGWIFAPGFTRAATVGATAIAGSDFLQLAWSRARQA
jgi:hypothetical protein